MPLLEVMGLAHSFYGVQALRGVDLAVEAHRITGLIGPNGAGKSTLFHLVSGRLFPTAGRIFVKGRDVSGRAPYEIHRLGLSRSFQVTNIFPRLSVFENVRCAVLWSKGCGYSIWRAVAKRRDVTERVGEVLEAIGLDRRRHTPAGVLTYAEQRALEIGLAIAGGSDVILLDEPTAGMSHSETEHAVALIRRVTAGRTLVMVEHDMSVVFDLADRISVLVYGEVIATGAPAAIRGNPAVQEAYLGQALAAEARP